MQAMATAIRPDLYQEHVNPQWAKLLDLLDMNIQYERCDGVQLHVDDGRTILDFLSGYGVHNAGHNHPRIIAALQNEWERHGPAILQSHVPDSAGELAASLSKLPGGNLHKGSFCAQISGNKFLVLKASPPLVVTRPQIDRAVAAAAEGLGSSGSLWTEAPALARGVINR